MPDQRILAILNGNKQAVAMSHICTELLVKSNLKV